MLMINQTTDKTGQQIKIFSSENLFVAPVLSLMLRTYAELLDNNKIPVQCDWKSLDKYRFIWAEDLDKNILGGVMYYLDFKKDWGHVYISFTNPNFRNRGINNICWNQFRDVAKAAGLTYTVGVVHPKNVEQLITSRRGGRKLVCRALIKKIG